MKSLPGIFFLFLLVLSARSQEPEPETYNEIEQQIENETEKNDETEDDSYLQQLRYYLKRPLNLNEAEANDLTDFKMLSALQIANFITYRNLFGAFINVYELQAVPLWDIPTIKKILPYIIIADTRTITQNIKERLFVGDNSLVLRFAMVIPRSKGFFRNDSSGNFYTGSRPQILVRYNYNYRNLLQYGILGEKDAGEQFFKGVQKQGFDFYSFHFFVRKSGLIQSLAVGDFTVNLGQGLIHWQRLAFKKSAAITAVKRQTSVLHPYNSAGEYQFHRGVGITIGRKKWEVTMFASFRKLSATLKTDSFNHYQYVSSLIKSGYHRSPSELTNRNNLQFLAIGANIKYHFAKGDIGINAVEYIFSKPFGPSGKPYDLFSISGKRWNNVSIDGGYSLRNIHVFGEIAGDKNNRLAVTGGMIASIDRSVDLSLLFRKIDMRYQSLNGNAFTEGTMPSNETGLYTGISIRPASGWKIDAYTDFYKFPWLLFRSNAPTYGADYLLRVEYIPSKVVTISFRYKKEVKQVNSDVGTPMQPVTSTPRRGVRYDLSYHISPRVLFRNRLESCWYELEENLKTGFLVYADIGYRSASKPYSVNTRIQYFETDGYEARIYAYENDLLFSNSSPAFYEKGFRWYLNLRTDISNWRNRPQILKIQLQIKYALTHYFELAKIGSELGEIQGNQRSELKLQLLFSR